MTKAQKLLREWSSPKQWKQWLRSDKKYMDVIGSHTGHRYRLFRRINRGHGNDVCHVFFVDRRNRLCTIGIYPDKWHTMPYEDYLLSIKLALETDEERVLYLACTNNFGNKEFAVKHYYNAEQEQFADLEY